MSSAQFEELLGLSMAYRGDDTFDEFVGAVHLEAAQRFIKSFSDSDMYSIDVWLEANRLDKQLLSIGKRAIAAIIIDAETTSKDEGAPLEQDWFAWLWNYMWTHDINDLVNNKVNFITFNYDRLFEWKLWQQIRNTYLGATEQQHLEAFAAFRQKIVHVHGVVKTSPNGNDLLKHYGDNRLHGLYNGRHEEIKAKKKKYAYLMHAAAQSINIVCEDSNDAALIEAARKFIHNETRLVFLGFSFDKRNVLKLGLDGFAKQRGNYGISKTVADNLDSLPIIGTGMGILRGERAAIEAIFNGLIALGPDNMDAVTFCRSHVKTD